MVVTHVWDTTQPIPTATPTETPTPLPTSPPTSTFTPPPSPTSTFTPAPTATPTVTPTPTPRPSGPVTFASPDDPNALNSVFGWQPGGSEASTYDLSMHPGELTLIAGPRTDLWSNTNTAPLVAYPYTGDFEAQVKVVFTPEGSNWKIAGLGVRSVQNPLNWIRITKGLHQEINVASGGGRNLNYTSYSNDTVYLRIKRQGPLFTLSYSSNGINWIDLQKDYVFEMSDDVEIFLTVYSTSNEGAIVQFSDFSVVIEGHAAKENGNDVIAVNTTTGVIGDENSSQSTDTAGDTIISPTDTPAPTPTLGLSCSKEPRGEFRNLWTKYQKQLGCRIQTEPLTGDFVEQPFEGGHMFWFAQADLFIVTIGATQGDWMLSKSEWNDSHPPESCAVQIPAGKFQPIRGFGWIWCHIQGTRDRIGWATDIERAFPPGIDLIQGFENGIIFRDSDGKSQGKAYIMFGKDQGTFIREQY